MISCPQTTMAISKKQITNVSVGCCVLYRVLCMLQWIDCMCTTMHAKSQGHEATYTGFETFMASGGDD